MKAAIQIIREADRGQLLDDLQKSLDDIVTAINSHGGEGKIVITLKVKAKGDAFQVSSALDVKVPMPPRLDSIMFFDPDRGELTRADPRQPVMPSVVEADFRNGAKRPSQED